MKNEIELCNISLAYLGLGAITSFAENSKEAELLCIVYPKVRDELLEQFDFSFATKIESLAHVENTDIHKQFYIYQLPTYCLRVRRVFTQEGYTFLNSRTIQSESPELIVEMTIRVDDVSLFSASFSEALLCKVASTVAIALTGNPALKVEYEKRFALAYDEAKMVDQNPSQGTMLESNWLEARNR